MTLYATTSTYRFHRIRRVCQLVDGYAYFARPHSLSSPVRQAIYQAQAVWSGTPFDRHILMTGFRYFVLNAAQEAT